jgi:hypothetical protein
VMVVSAAVVGCGQFELQSESQMCNFCFQGLVTSQCRLKLYQCYGVHCSHHLLTLNVTGVYNKSETDSTYDTVNPMSQNYASDIGHDKVRLCKCGHSELFQPQF